MKIINKQIDMVAHHSKDGIQTPMKFRLQEGDERIIIKVGRVVESQEGKFGGQRYITYVCESTIDDIEKRYELRLEVERARWTLFKM